MCIILSFAIWSSACLETNLNWTPINFRYSANHLHYYLLLLPLLLEFLINYSMPSILISTDLIASYLVFSTFSYVVGIVIFGRPNRRSERLKTYWKSHNKYQKQYSNKNILDPKVCSLITVLSYWCVHGSVC